MPPVVIAAIIGAGAGLAGGGLSAHAASKAGEAEANAATVASQAQAKAAADTLAFEKAQAAQSRADNIAAQNANFGQWGYRQNTIRPYQGAGLEAENSLAQMLGLPAINTQLPDLPAAPNFSGSQPSSGPPSSTPSGPTPAVDGSPESIAAYFKARNTTPAPTTVQYFASKWPELVARGKELNDPNYAMTRLSQAEEFGGSKSAAPQTIGSYAGMPPMPMGNGSDLPFVPGSLGAYAGAA